MPLDLRHGFQYYQYHPLYFIRVVLYTDICNANQTSHKNLTD